MAIDKIRKQALSVIEKVLHKGAYSNIELSNIFKANEYEARDKAFISELVYGVLSNKNSLDYIISKYSKIKPKKMQYKVLNTLRLSVYQIFFMDKVPDSAACNESVNILKKVAPKASGFGNGVLRSIIRDKQNIKLPEGNTFLEMSIKYSFPEWMVENFINQYGIKEAKNVMESLNTHNHIALRVNTLKITQEELLKTLTKKGFDVCFGDLPDSIFIKKASGIFETEEYKKGYFIVQNQGSMFVSLLLNPKKGSKVLDACSAPGTKTTHIAQIIGNEGEILACDIHGNKLNLIEQNAKRLGISIINTKVMDAGVYNSQFKEEFDYVLLDVPCSGTGIIANKPEIKWERTSEDINSLVEIQKKILYNSSRYVKKGGTLVYSTCSLIDSENQNVIEWFLGQNDEFYEDVKGDYTDCFKQSYKSPGFRLLPSKYNTDGFYAVRLKRKK